MSVETEPDDSAPYVRERAGTELVNQAETGDYDLDIGRANRGNSHLLNTDPGEPGWLGNPHPVGDKCPECKVTHPRDGAVTAYRRDFYNKIQTDPTFRQAVEHIQGDRLACYCVPELCHGDVILEYLDKGEIAILRWENKQLRDDLERVETEMARLVNTVVDRLTDGEIEDFHADPMQSMGLLGDIHDRFTTTETKVDRHESIIQEQNAINGDPKEENWWKVVEFAHNVSDKRDHRLPDGWVQLYKENIADATGLSERRGGQLIDEWSEEKDGVRKRPYKRLSTSRKTNGSSIQRKALKINLDVWEADE